MKNSILVSIPMAIAALGLAGNVAVKDRLESKVRLTPAAISKSLDSAELSDDQVIWLKEHNPLGIPQTQFPGSRTLVVRQGYTLAHNNVDLIADWVTYHLTKKYVTGEETRPGSSAFKPDPKLPSGRRAELDDYKGWKNIFDRGHQVASGDSKGRGKRVIRESFFLSNMTPQSSKLNQHRWRLLEQYIQSLAESRGELWVITGPAFIDDDSDGLVRHLIIGDNQVSVPTHYYKIVLAKSPSNSDVWEAMAFLIPNEPLEDPDGDYLVSIDEIEEKTGFDFFSLLDDVQEKKLEKKSPMMFGRPKAR